MIIAATVLNGFHRSASKSSSLADGLLLIWSKIPDLEANVIGGDEVRTVEAKSERDLAST